MVIIGLEGCPRCKLAQMFYPSYKYVEIPRISLGIGDTIAKLTNFLGIKTCEGCRFRQYKCNKWLPYFWRKKNIKLEIIRAKELSYKNKVLEFPVLANDDLTKIEEKIFEKGK